MLAVLGLDPLKYLYTTDSFERDLLMQVAKVAQKQLDVLNNNLAVQIASKVGELFKK